MIKPSFFMDKAVVPLLSDVENLLPQNYPQWQKLISYVYENYPDIKEEWTHSGKSYG